MVAAAAVVAATRVAGARRRGEGGSSSPLSEYLRRHPRTSPPTKNIREVPMRMRSLNPPELYWSFSKSCGNEARLRRPFLIILFENVDKAKKS